MMMNHAKDDLWPFILPYQKKEETMRLSLKALALTAGILWAMAVLLVGAANLVWSGYGVAFVQLMASIYPGYHASGSFGDLIVGVLYALLDGIVCGLVFAWLYNLFTGR
jgi:hypothetical protein